MAASKKKKSAGAPAPAKNAKTKASKGAKAAKAQAKPVANKKNSKSKKGAKQGVLSGVIGYFKAVRTEMKRVVWPTPVELRNYSVAVIVALVVVGAVIAVLDMGISEGLVAFSGLRG